MRSPLPLLALALALGLGLLTACSSSTTTGSTGTSPTPPPGTVVVGDSPAPPATTTPPAPPAAGTPALSADKKHFAADTKYQGKCAAPAGRGRGGCYVLTFHPDGRAEHLLLDATESGTYRIEGTTVIYRSTLPDAQDDRYESTDGFRTLGTDYHYAP
jgi:hypothetical protein